MSKFTIALTTNLMATVLMLPVIAEAGVVTGPPVAGFTTVDNTKDNVLTSASPTFAADMSTYATFASEVHSLLGDNTTPGQSDFEFQDNTSADGIHGDIFLPYAMVGRAANGQNGTVLYKFVVQSGYETAAGGTISANMYFRHDPVGAHGQNAWIGVTTNTPVIAGDLGGFASDAGFTTVTMEDRFGPGSGYASYTGLVTLDVPVGATTFYVAFSDVFQGIDGSAGSSARLAIGGLNVNAILSSTSIPEPASLMLLAAGGAAMFIRRR